MATFKIFVGCVLCLLLGGLALACRLKEGQKMEACHEDKNLNQTMCLQFNCCFSLKGKHEPTCYTPVVDRIQLSIRSFIFSSAFLVLLGCIPTCFRVFCQKRKPVKLRMRNSGVTRSLLKHRSSGKHRHRSNNVKEHLLGEQKRRRKKKKSQKGKSTY
ncbi:FMR1 neighbor protein isoform X2 [Macrotis lagotis]|uniref:FMR1 neighbor protein isoform X2 n=1 Tax=Macrotis lagotis TaxID=92651 RepID=UPI003D686A61